MAQTICISVEKLQLAQSTCISVEIVAIGPDYARFSGNSCNWLKIWNRHFRVIIFLPINASLFPNITVVEDQSEECILFHRGGGISSPIVFYKSSSLVLEELLFLFLVRFLKRLIRICFSWFSPGGRLYEMVYTNAIDVDELPFSVSFC